MRDKMIRESACPDWLDGLMLVGHVLFFSYRTLGSTITRVSPLSRYFYRE